MKKKRPLSRKGILRTKKGFIAFLIVIILIITLLISTMYSFSCEKNIYEYKNIFIGKPMTINESANLIDKINTNNNIVISPYNIYTSINYIYKYTDNLTYKEIKLYTGYNYNKYNEIITNMENNNKIENNQDTDINKLYEELINELINKGYANITINEIKSLKDKKELLNIISKINITYEHIIGENNYDRKYINSISPSKTLTALTAYELKIEIEKILEQYESYSLKSNLININKLYLNNNYYDNILDKNISLLDFNDSKNIINDNIKELTDNNIKFYIDENILSNNNNLYLNTLIFNMEWSTNYNIKNNKNIEFTGLNNKKTVVEAMNENIYSYLDNGYAKGFKKDFKNNKYSFIAILPNDINTTNISNINIESLLKSEKNNELISVTIPKINCQYELDLNDLYNSIGIKDVNNNKANFNNLIENQFNLEYNKQRILINIGEKGTYNTNIKTQELESFTKYDNQRELIFNRPFFYLIINNETKDVLLIGKILNF